jgi:hypothetical protein
VFTLVAQLLHVKEEPGSTVGMKIFCSKAFMVSLSPLNFLQSNISDWATIGLIFSQIVLSPEIFSNGKGYLTNEE